MRKLSYGNKQLTTVHVVAICQLMACSNGKGMTDAVSEPKLIQYSQHTRHIMKMPRKLVNGEQTILLLFEDTCVKTSAGLFNVTLNFFCAIFGKQEKRIRLISLKNISMLSKIPTLKHCYQCWCLVNQTVYQNKSERSWNLASTGIFSCFYQQRQLLRTSSVSQSVIR